jgi:glutaminyl-tRNA synthetase
LKWADGKLVITTINEKKDAVIGPKPKGWKAPKPAGGKGKKDKKKKEDKPEEDGVDNEMYKPKDRLSKILARDLATSHNTKANLETHHKATGGKVVTRFPPEPNGYLHIGHAKAMRFSFSVAEDYDGICFLRFDDTNPEKESIEYIDNIIDNVKWLGYTPHAVTYSSDYFPTLYEYAIKLIKKGKAFVCHQPKEEMNEDRKNGIESPFRERSIEDNLKLFNDMKMGKCEEGECCLRMKIDMDSNNPCMRDPVAYRIKYCGHPHTGDNWCIYPTYDMTHCVIDSMENITHSLCTLEFEVRRDSYYWLLDQLEIYKAYQWEYGRLNVSGTILSKRKIDALIQDGKCSGWDDPRLMTLMGLKRKGYTPEAINNFIDCLGTARKGNENVVDNMFLEYIVRKDFEEKAQRSFCVLDPVKLVIEGVPDDWSTEVEGELFPGFPEKGTIKFPLT